MIIIGVQIILFLQLSAQYHNTSIHAEQRDYYSQFGKRETGFYDSLSGFTARKTLNQNADCQLKRIVFGFHPYWAGSDYLNYQWNLISDFCYFDYEVDPSTGDPVSYHDWLTDPAIDSAKAHGVKVHLCATLFQGHNSFFTSMASRQNLIDNLISLLQQRNADGINMDIEALPSSMSDSVTAFMQEFSLQLKVILPDAKLSIDLPAVDWETNFQISKLNNCVDWYFIMGYDYYWNGSSQAGPVSPLYSLTSGYDYSLSRTISAFESAGVSQEKFILGIPYYGRQWKTLSNNVPSQTLASGSTLTYANVRSNTGTYNPANYYWEPNSFSSCYIFFQNDNWNQCFIGLDRDLRKKYDIVRYRDLAGIGVWALGYDNGYPDLWQAISDKFTDCYIPLIYDTLYDSGGPSWNYYTGEDYVMTIDQGFNDSRWLSFADFNLEEGYDSLWLYAGSDTTYPFLGGFSGSINPGNFSSSNGVFTLRFKSDPMQNALGWGAVYHDGSLGIDISSTAKKQTFRVFPSPSDQYVNIELVENEGNEKIFINDFAGKTLFRKDLTGTGTGQKLIQLNLSALPGGIYNIFIVNDMGQLKTSQIIKLHR